ncbi:MAG: hypothetical protein WBF93_05845 [Pirellulales bacterium]
MADELGQRIAGVRRRARWTTIIYGVGWTVVVVLVCAVLIGALDYFLRVENLAVRLLFSTALLAAVGWGVYRFFWPAFNARPSDVALGQRIQQRFPDLKGKLASAIEFATQDEADELAGSAGLRRAVIVQATAAMDEVSAKQVVDRRPAYLASVATAATFGLLGMLVVFSPNTTRIAAQRMIIPFGGEAWPSLNELVFHEPPTRLAAGSLFEVELHDAHNHMPENVVIDYRFDDEHGAREFSEPMQPVGEVMVAHRDNVRRSFQYRAHGGDDQDMEWQTLEVVEPPRVESLSVTIEPPAYSGWPISESTGRIVGLNGSNIRLVVVATKPVSTAAVVLQDGSEIPGEISADGRTVSVPASGVDAWQIDQSGTYSLLLADAEGISDGGADKRQIRAIPDEPPTVTVEQPSGDVHVTKNAIIPLQVIAKDRLAVRDIQLNFIRGGEPDQGERKFALYEGPEKAELVPSDASPSEFSEGERRVVQYDWDLSLLELAPGTLITFHAAARDYQLAEGKSPSQRIFVLGRGEIADRFGRRQAAILSEVARVLQRQKDVRLRTRELEIQLTEVEQQAEDGHQLQSVELAQRNVRRALAADRDSVLAQIRSLTVDIKNNKIGSPSMTRQLEELGQRIEQLEREDLTTIQQELTRAQKNLASELETKSEGKPDQSARDSLQQLVKAGEHQDHVIQVLEETLGDLQRSDSYRQFGRKLAALQELQGEIGEATDKMQERTLGRDVRDLPPQELADLKKIAERQTELARRFDKLLEGMDKATKDSADSDPLAADAISDAANFARDQGLSNQMRNAGRNVSKNNVGQASGLQKSAIDDLKEMQDILGNRREQELARLVKKLKQAEAELEAIRKEQAGLLKKMNDSQKLEPEERKRQLQRLTRQQRELQEATERLMRRLRRLQANRASEKLGDAAGQMAQSEQAGQQGDDAGAEQQAKQAERDLDEAQKQLAKARRAAEADLAEELLTRLQDQLKGLADREQIVLDNTRRLQELRAQQGQLTRGQLAGVRQLAAQQESVYDETRVTSEKLSGAEVLQRTLNRAAEKMTDAAQRLTRFDTSEATQGIEKQALGRLQLLIKAFAQDGSGSPKEGGGSGGQGGKGGMRLSLVQLKLLKLIQSDLNLRTEELRQEIDETVAQGGDVNELLKRREQLAEEQGDLADSIYDMSESNEADPEEDPDNLPDVRPDNVDGPPDALENDPGLEDDRDEEEDGGAALVVPPSGGLPNPDTA